MILRRYLGRATLAALLWCAAARCADAPAWWRPTLRRGPYIQMPSENSVVIVWRTLGKTTPVVRYGTDPKRLDRRVAGDAVRVEERLLAHYMGGSAPDGLVQYEATISGLKPRTTYYYAVYDGERLLAGGDATYRFRTAPRRGEAAPLRFVAFGDSGVGSWGQRQTYLAFEKALKKEGRPADLWLGLGDIDQARGADIEYQQVVFQIYPEALRNTPYWGTPGNHDIIRIVEGKAVGPYAQAFVSPERGECGGTPSGTRAYYSFDYGRVHFISLNTFQADRSPAGAMAKWLRADMARVKAEGKTDWLIAFTHAPWALSSLGLQPSSVEFRMHLMPLLEEAGVDLVLGGHIHHYQRSVLTDGVYRTPASRKDTVVDDGDGDPAGDGPYRKSAGLNPHEGTVAVVVGTGGGGTFLESLCPFTRTAFCEYGVLAVDIEGDTLTGRFINLDGKVRDRFQIVKRGKVPRRRVADPRPGPTMRLRRRLWGERFVQIPMLDEEIVLDGRFETDRAWRRAVRARMAGFYDALLFARKDGLYIAFHWGNAQARTAARNRDGALILDAGLEILVDANYDRKTFYRFQFNSAGVRADSRNDDFAYNPAWQVKTRRRITREQADAIRGMGLRFGRVGEAWSAEARIPWAAIGLDGPPPPDRPLGMNLITHTPGWTHFWFPKQGRYEQTMPPEIYGTVRVGPGRSEMLIRFYDEWAYLTGDAAPKGWTAPDFDDARWKRGRSGFGYGDLQCGTTFTDMKGRYRTVRIRRAFEVKNAGEITDLHLMIHYDDAFIVYLNGKEVLRRGVGPRGEVTVHEGTGPPYDWAAHRRRVQRDVVAMVLPGKPLYHEYFPLTGAVGLLREGRNVVAIEGRNASLDSKAFMLDPYLLCTRRPAAAPETK